MAVQAGLCLAWSETPEDTFCHVVVHIYIFFFQEKLRFELFESGCVTLKCECLAPAKLTLFVHSQFHNELSKVRIICG